MHEVKKYIQENRNRSNKQIHLLINLRAHKTSIHLTCLRSRYGLRPGAFVSAAADSQTAASFEQCLQAWCNQIESLLYETETREEGDTAGPDTELEFWRTRMAKFNSITEQMKKPDYRLVLGTCSSIRSPAFKKWKSLDVKVLLHTLTQT